MTTVTGKTAENLGKYLVVYFCIMALAGLQFIIAFQDLGARQMFHRMFVVALAEAGQDPEAVLLERGIITDIEENPEEVKQLQNQGEGSYSTQEADAMVQDEEPGDTST